TRARAATGSIRSGKRSRSADSRQQRAKNRARKQVPRSICDSDRGKRRVALLLHFHFLVLLQQAAGNRPASFLRRGEHAGRSEVLTDLGVVGELRTVDFLLADGAFLVV